MREAAIEYLKEAKRLVFFGGAGVSTESGIPDFRSTGGLFREGGWKVPPEVMVSHSFFRQNPEEFYRFYRSRMLWPDAKPNAAHTILAKWEKEGWLSGIITQNIDGLHQEAGSSKVVELHGSVHRNHCMRCHTFVPLSEILSSEGVPRCPSCGGIVKPDVVLYEEALDPGVIHEALRLLEEADTVLVAGTSLRVYPAASFLSAYRGHRLIICNKDATEQDERADLCIRDSIGHFLTEADKILNT